MYNACGEDQQAAGHQSGPQPAIPLRNVSGLLIPVAASDPGTPLRYASLAGFCYTLPVALIAAVPLSEGECIEDFFSGRISDNKRRQ